MTEVQAYKDCYPAPIPPETQECTSLRQLEWGNQTPGALVFPKFKESDGQLVSVELKVTAQHVGELCIDNPQNDCCLFDGVKQDLRLILTGENNTPVLNGGQIIQFLGSTDIQAIPNFTLAPDNNNPDCPVGAGVQADGMCGGGDFFKNNWDTLYTPQSTVLTSSADLMPFIYSAGSSDPMDIMYKVTATNPVSGTICIPALAFMTSSADARVEIDVIYTFCPKVAPICDPDGPTVQVAEDTFADIDLFKYAYDADNCLLCDGFSIFTQPAHGQVMLSTPVMGLGNGVNMDAAAGCNDCSQYFVKYIPDTDYCGPDSFEFLATDEDGERVMCLVPIMVNGINDPLQCLDLGTGPGSMSNPIHINEDTFEDFNFCDFVEDPDEANADHGVCGTLGCTVMGTPIVSPANSTITDNGDGTWRFKAPFNYCGDASITFVACDDAGRCSDPCTIYLFIDPVNDPPLCTPPGRPLMVMEDGGPLTIDLCQYVFDPDTATCPSGLDETTITNVTSDCGGTVTPTSGSCTVQFTPKPNFCGPCNISFDICDSAGSCITMCSIPILVSPVNDPLECKPLGPNDPGSMTTPIQLDEDTTLPNIDLCRFVIDPDNPLTNPDISSACGALGCTVMGITGVTPAGAMVTDDNGDGKWDYTPPADYCGPGSITFIACDDGNRCSGPCTIYLNVNGVNDPPECVSASPVDLGDLCQGDTLQIDFKDYITDPDSLTPGCGHDLDPTTILPTASCGSLMAVDPVLQPGVFIYTAPTDSCGICTISVSACDLGTPGVDQECLAAACPFTVDIQVANHPPVCRTGPDICVPEDSVGFPLDLTAYVNDPDDDGSGCAPIIGPDGYSATVDCGTIVHTGGGMFEFTPPPNYCGPCQITLTACDTGGVAGCGGTTTDPLCVDCVIDVCVQPINDPPVAEDDNFVTTEGTAIVVDLCANDYDPEGNTPSAAECGCGLDCSSIVIGASDPPGCGTLVPDPSGNGKFIFTPAPGVVDTVCCFTYEIWDACTGHGSTSCTPDPCPDLLTRESDTAEVCINVLPCIETNLRNPGSLLIYPEFDNRDGFETIQSLTNTSPNMDITVVFQFVREDTCSRVSHTKTLTANDTFTFKTDDVFADKDHGYAYVYAICETGGEPVSFDYLIGNSYLMDGFQGISYAVNAISFPGINDAEAPITPCGLRSTERTGDNIRNFDGQEYGPTPDRIYIPRFVGQDVDRNSDVILIALSGGQKFTTTLDLIIFNDNEQDFSSQVTFFCWERVPLLSISSLFSNSFLQGTNNDPNEILGMTTVESGWIVLDGRSASSTSTTILDPAFYAVLVEQTAFEEQAADLPWSRGCQTNGGLLPITLTGD